MNGQMYIDLFLCSIFSPISMFMLWVDCSREPLSNILWDGHWFRLRRYSRLKCIPKIYFSKIWSSKGNVWSVTSVLSWGLHFYEWIPVIIIWMSLLAPNWRTHSSFYLFIFYSRLLFLAFCHGVTQQEGPRQHLILKFPASRFFSRKVSVHYKWSSLWHSSIATPNTPRQTFKITILLQYNGQINCSEIGTKPKFV